MINMKPCLGLVVILLACAALGGVACADETDDVNSGIAFSELLFNPEGAEIDGEFVELICTASSPLNISGWSLGDQDAKPEIVFPEVTVAPGELIVVYTSAGENRTSCSPYIFHLWASSPVWNNQGDDALLTDAHGTVAAYLSYGNGSAVDPCPEEGKGQSVSSLPEEGYSLALQAETGAWRACMPSPGASNPQIYPAGSALVVEVCYSPAGGSEYVRIAAPGSQQIDLKGWALSDREGILGVPQGTLIAQGGTIYAAENATLFNLTFGRQPDLEWAEMHSNDPGFKLANEGDEVLLLDPWGTVIDAYVYGSSAYDGAGWIGEPVEPIGAGKVSVRYLEEIYTDTDTAADWDKLREYMPGQTEIAPALFRSANLTFYAFPDAGFEAVSHLIQSAQSTIELNLYDISSCPAAQALAAKAAGGVRVRVMVEGSPVSGLSSASVECLDIVAGEGGEVRLMLRSPYNFNHAKYMIIDHSTLFISTENWGANGLPSMGTSGNRGWAVSVHEKALAAYFLQVFESDWNTSTPWDEAKGRVKVQPQEPLDVAGRALCRFPPMNASSEALIIPVLAPDNSLSEETVLGMIHSARESVLVEQFYIHNSWAKRVHGSVLEKDNPFMSALVDAARRGCEVRVLLDATWYNTDQLDENDNDDTVRYLNTLAALEDLRIHAKLVRLETHDFVKIHAKGIIVDRAKVLISSINWNRNSVVENREAGLLIEGSEAATYFAEVFEHDWTDDFTPPEAVIVVQGERRAGSPLLFSAEGSRDDMGIERYEWWVDDTATSNSGPSLAWTFASPGTHEVLLSVRDAWGNSNTTSVILDVSAAPVSVMEMNNRSDEKSDAMAGAGSEPRDDSWLYLTVLALPGVLVAICWIIVRKDRTAGMHPFIHPWLSGRDAHRGAAEGSLPTEKVQLRVHQVLSKGEDGRRDCGHGG
ncbi:MAG: phospholipase D-like domain-containing protein [Candidatus Thermoplasmatota archaeon]